MVVVVEAALLSAVLLELTLSEYPFLPTLIVLGMS